MKEKTFALPLISQKTLTIILSIISFVIPFSLGQPQVLVGSLVNAAIIASAVYLPSNLALPMIILPSLAVLLRGLIFGPFTYFLVIMLPAIWVGNWLLFIIIRTKPVILNLFQDPKGIPIQTKSGRHDGINYFINLFIAALIKFLFLYSFALILFNLKIIPKLFLTSMGWLQFITAMFGGFLVMILKFKIKN
jgi:hypothetical protein